MQDAVHMLAVNGSLSMSCDDTNSQPRVKIILGALYSGVTMAVARLLNVYMVPLVSHKQTEISKCICVNCAFIYQHLET